MSSEQAVLKIAITGKFRSGKDRVAWRLFYQHDFAPPIAFGDKLKRTVRDLLPWLGDNKPRAYYQRFGQLMREHFDEDIWIKHAAQTVQYYEGLKTTRGIVISDLRQPNEYKWAKANGFMIIRVNAPDELRIARAKEAGDDFSAEDVAHETEQHVDKFAVDYEISNDGTLAELYAQVDGIIAEIERKGAV